MSIQIGLHFAAEKITIGILIALACINAVWAVITGYFGHFIGYGIYTYILFLCQRKKHYQAGIIGGILGFGFHFYELLFRGTEELTGIQLTIFFINLIFPLLLLYFSYQAYQLIKLKSKGNNETRNFLRRKPK